MTKILTSQKSNYKKTDITDFKVTLPDLKNTSDSKPMAIAKWLKQTINNNIKSGNFKFGSLLPSKADFAYILGVSTGTMQSAFRILEDHNIVESKQYIGTIIKNSDKNENTVPKFMTKRDCAIEDIKIYIASNSFNVNSYLPSTNAISAIIGYSYSVTKMALEYLTSIGIIEKKNKNFVEYIWVVKSCDFDYDPNYDKNPKTLVDKISSDIENYISKNLKVGDKLPPLYDFARDYNTSVKSIHDAVKRLVNKNILQTRRGKYGTIVVKMPNEKEYLNEKPESSIFAPAQDAMVYLYEKTIERLKRMIANEYEIGDKLPSIAELSKTLDLSPNTLRRSLTQLGKEGYLVFSRGRYGGTFVIDIPEVETQAFKWIAVNPQYSKNLKSAN